jgi:ABC-type amino acid transport system permease subunit
MQRLRPPAAIAAGALALWLALPAYLNYDTAWSLVWGGELARGAKPNLEALSAPTPHPLGTLLGVLLAPLEGAAGDVATLLVLGSLAAVVWLALELGRAWFGGAAGWIAAVLALTSVPLLTTAARAYLDVPYLALVLGALLVETRRPRAGAPVLTLLAVAGLWRPEAWLFSAAYWVWSARGRPRVEAARLAALAAAAPLAWFLGDLVLAGDPLHSFTWTREQAAALGRARGPGALQAALPDKLAHAAGLPILIAGTVGLALLLRRRPRDGGLAASALGAALATAATLTAAGMPVVERYLLLPLVLLIVLAAGVAGGAWTSLVLRAGRGATPRRPMAVGIVLGATVLVLLAASVPGRLSEVAAQRGDLAAQASLRADLRTLADRGALPPRCARVAASNHKLIPLLALWTGRAPVSFSGGEAEAYVEPATAAAQRTLLLASSDPPEAAPAPPAGAVEVARNGAWRVEARC